MNTNPTLTLTYKGEQIISTLTDAEAANVLARVPANHSAKSFATSLCNDLARWGNLFPNKRYFLHKLAAEQLERELPATKPIPTGYLPRIAAFLTPASEKLKSGARVSFSSGDLQVVIKRAGTTSNWPGSFHVTGYGFGENGDQQIYAGRISPEGGWYPSGACTSEVFALLDEFESDPAEYAAAYGRRTGKCAFCGYHLDDEISMGFGYGPVCAKHYRLPYGKRALAAAIKCRESRAVNTTGAASDLLISAAESDAAAPVATV